MAPACLPACWFLAFGSRLRLTPARPVCWPEQSCPGSVAPSAPTNVTVQLASEPLYPRPVLSYPADVSQCDGIRVVGSGRADPPHLLLVPPLLSHRR